MRLAVAVTGDGQVVRGIQGEARYVRVLVEDRTADGVAFPGERMVRLPRRFTRGRGAYDRTACALRWTGQPEAPGGVAWWPWFALHAPFAVRRQFALGVAGNALYGRLGVPEPGPR